MEQAAGEAGGVADLARGGKEAKGGGREKSCSPRRGCDESRKAGTELAGKGRPQTLTGAEEARWEDGEAGDRIESGQRIPQERRRGAPQPTNQEGGLAWPAESRARDLDGSARRSLGGGGGEELGMGASGRTEAAGAGRGRGC